VTFADALSLLLTGHQLTRREWDDESFHILLVGEFLMIRKPEGTLHSLILCRGDLEATDWVLVDEDLEGTPSPPFVA
jgi:hypothetical protein